MTKDEALRMALEALEKLFGIPDMLTGENSGDVAVWRLGGSYRTRQAIHAIKEALAQSETEWVGLTDEEMRELEKQFEAERVRTSDEEYLVIYPAAYWQWQRAIEAKLKEKNT